jgi:hypothetical protein
VSPLPTFIQSNNGIHGQNKKAREGNKRNSNREGKKKSNYPYLYDMILNLKDPKDSTKKYYTW